MTAPIRSMPETLMIADNGEVIAVVRTMQDAVDVFRLMKERLGLTNEFIDDVGGLTKGHADKILGPSEEKRLGYDTFALLTALTAVEFRVHIDMDAIKRMEAIWEKRERPLYPNAKVKRISKKLIERAKPHVLQDLSKVGNDARKAMLPAKHRSAIARKAAKIRWKKERAKRRAIARATPCTTPVSVEPSVPGRRSCRAKHTICVLSGD